MKKCYASFAIDLRHSTRVKDENGYLHVATNNLTRAQVRPYLGKEISAGDDMGWDADKVYNLLCPPDELKKAADRYNGLPLLLGHENFDSDDPPKDKVIGATGTAAKYHNGFLQNSLSVWDASAVKAIEDGDIPELSCGYGYDLDPTSGTHEGTAYHGIMRNIRPNHVALVEKGRAGSEVRVGDAALDGDRPGHAGHGNQYTGGVAQMQKGVKLVKKKSNKITVAVPREKVMGDIAKRKSVSPKSGVEKYGAVKFADPKNKKYPIDTPEHVRAALSYIGMPKNQAKYNPKDLATIKGRIHAAAKRLGIGKTTGDSAGSFKETTMAKANKALSPLAHRVAGAVQAHLRTKLAADAEIKPKDLLGIVKNVSEARFGKQVAGIAGSIKDKYGLDSAEELRRLLLDLMPKDEDDESEDEDDESEDEDDEDDKSEDEDSEDEDDEDEDSDDEDDESKAEREVEKKVAKKVLGKKAVKKGHGVFPDKKPKKKGMDADTIRKQLQDEFKALRQAEKDVQPLVGNVEGMDTATQVYKYALDHAGVDTENVHASAFPAMVKLLVSQATPSRNAKDERSANATLERFPALKSIRRIG